jgi:cyclic pyranopterin phosphate synthase
MNNKSKIDESKFFLRFAITPNCNFRCEYCNPDGKIETAGILNDKEILQIMKAGYDAGVNRVHWTGGEPTLKNMVKLISESRNIGYIEQVLTTNGSRGGDYVKEMVDSGLDRLIVSLDTLDPIKFKEITKKDCLDKVLETIETSVEILEQPTKVNVVYMEDTKNELPYLIEFGKRINNKTQKRGELVVKFIEITKMNPAFFTEDGKQLYSSAHTGKEIMLKELSKFGSLIPADKDVIGNNPNTHYFNIPEIGIKIGMINIPSTGYNCGGQGCAKVRLNPYGKIAVCVNQYPIDIKGKSLIYQTEVISDLQTYRRMLDKFYPRRKHKQDETNFGFWRFGNCGDNNTKK